MPNDLCPGCKHAWSEHDRRKNRCKGGTILKRCSCDYRPPSDTPRRAERDDTRYGIPDRQPGRRSPSGTPRRSRRDVARGGSGTDGFVVHQDCDSGLSGSGSSGGSGSSSSSSSDSGSSSSSSSDSGC